MSTTTLTSDTPRWAASIDAARRLGTNGVILELNTVDRVRDPVTGRYLRLREATILAASRQGPVATYSLAAGLQQPQISNDHTADALDLPVTGSDPVEIVAALRRLFLQHENVTLVVDHADLLVPDGPGGGGMLEVEQRLMLETFHDLGSDPVVRDRGGFIVLISHEGAVANALRGRGTSLHTITVPLPDADERRAFIDRLLDVGIGSLSERVSGSTLARSTGGLRLSDIEALLRASNEDDRVTPQRVDAQKADVLRRLGGDILTVETPKHHMDDLVGLPHVKDALSMIGTTMPRAMLLVGPPGGGKSYTVAALGGTLNVPVVSLTPRSMWVGESERRMRRALQLIEELAPCVVRIDEIDRQWGRRRSSAANGDSGVSDRLEGQLWEFLGDGAGNDVLVVGCSNRPDLLDPATIDRFAITLPYLHPGRDQIAALLPDLARQVGTLLASDVDVHAAAGHPSLSSFPTVRGLLSVVRVAADRAEHDGSRLIRAVDLMGALDDYRPNADPVEHELLALEAVRMCDFASHLPWMSRQGRRPNVVVPGYLEPLVGNSGHPDHDALSARIQRLRAHHLGGKR